MRIELSEGDFMWEELSIEKFLGMVGIFYGRGISQNYFKNDWK